jgi:hypothetical protein
MSCRIAGKIDVGRTPHDAPSSISADGIACRNTEWHLPFSARDEDAVFALLHRLDKTAAPYVHTELQHATFEKRLRHCLGQELYEWEARFEHREVQRVSSAPK